MLDRLPPEIFLLILPKVLDKKDINRLSQVSRKLHSRTVPELYRSIDFLASEDSDLVDFGVESFLASSCGNLKYIQGLHFGAFFRHSRRRCPDVPFHGQLEILDDRAEPSIDEHENQDDIVHQEPHTGRYRRYRMVYRRGSHFSAHRAFMNELEAQIVPLLALLPFDNLRTFSWSLNTCIPKLVLLSLATRQPNIRSLSAITDANCGAKWDTHYHHLRLTQLRKLSWRGFGVPELTAVGALLRSSAWVLKEIEIDRVDPSVDKNCNSPPRSQLAYEFLKLMPGEQSLLFPCLQKLSLSGFDLISASADIISAFNFSQLHSLKLRDCPNADELLSMLASSSLPLRLTCFEFIYLEYYKGQDDLSYLARFLHSFRGLEEFHVLYPDLGKATNEFWPSVLHHKSTLERLLVHETVVQLNPQFASKEDRLIKALSGQDNLRCLGICCRPIDLSSALAQISPRPSCKLIHIRVTGWVQSTWMRHDADRTSNEKFSSALPEALVFARWAFGPNGLPDLQILAFGDFALQGRRPNILLCREKRGSQVPQTGSKLPSPFREVTRDEARSWNIVQENVDFLSACPEDRLMRR